MSPDQRELRIRNQRYRPWVKIAGAMLMVLFMATVALQFLDRPYDRLARSTAFVCLVGMAVYCLRTYLLILNMQAHPLPGVREAARAVFDRAFRGVRRNELDRVVGVAVERNLFGWLVPRRIPVAFLLFGDTVAFDSRFPTPLRAVRRVRFAPDPAEDYAEWEQPHHYCAAAIELAMRSEFRLIVDEADARRLRQWATTRGIPVCDEDGYSPRSFEPASEVAAHE